jgi:hypothetical protein
MSTNWHYAPVAFQDTDTFYKERQWGPTRSAYSLEDEQMKLQYPPDNDRKLYRGDTGLTMTNNVNRDPPPIPNWPGPQMLAITGGKRLLFILGYVLFLVPPLVFLGKDNINMPRRLNRANFYVL